MASNQYLARLGFVLALDSSELVTNLTETQKKFNDFSNEVKRDTSQAAKAILELDLATKSYGKTLTKVEQIQQDIDTGKYAKAEEWMKKALLDKAAAYDKVAASAQKANAAQNPGGLSRQQQQAIMYQTTDTITSLMGGQNPLMVLMQQGGQLKDQFGGLKPMFAGLAASITPVGIAITAVGASVLGLGYAFYQGSKEAEKFNAAIALTNNYAGMTANEFNSLARSIGNQYNQSIGSTRDTIQMLVASGQFAGKAIESVANVIASFAKVSGESASVVAEKLMPAFDGTAASAAKLNNQYHFLNVEQYKHIESLEKQGKFQESITYTADAFNQKLKEQQETLGPLSALWKDVAKSVADYYDKIKQFVSNGPSVAMQLDMAAQHVAAMKAAWGDDSEKTKKAIQDYIDLVNKYADAAEAAATKSDEDEKNRREIAFQQKYGQQIIDLNAKITEEKVRKQYAIEAKGLDEISQLEKKKAMEDALAALELKRKIAKDPQISGTLKDVANAEAERKKADLALQQSNISRDELRKYQEKAIAEQDVLDKEKERLDIYRQNLLASDADLQIAMSRLKTEQEIAEIQRNKKIEDPIDKAVESERLRKIQQNREFVINQARDLKMLQDMNKSVFSNMESAIDNFVRTGKLSFKDLTKSIIQDLLAIAMKAQMLAMFRGFSFFGGGGGAVNVGTVTGADMMQAFADGGSPPVGVPSLVGERGPELFIPRTAGTIVPNDKLASTMGGTTNVTNNYINAIDTKSFEQRLLGSSNTIWAANQYANKSLAAAGGRS